MALSRPDISHAMLDRKQNAMKQAGKADADVLLTNCPSCLQGLGRLKKRGVKPIHMAEELARLTGGEGWQKKLKDHLSRARVIPV